MNVEAELLKISSDIRASVCALRFIEFLDGANKKMGDLTESDKKKMKKMFKAIDNLQEAIALLSEYAGIEQQKENK